MQSPWGELPVSDAHIHFFSYRFFSALAEQKGVSVPSLSTPLAWQLPEEQPERLAEVWVRELDRHGVLRAVLIGSLPGDHESVIAAVRRYPMRLVGYAMVNPLLPDAVEQVHGALSSRYIRGLCFFPAMHRYSIQDERVTPLLDAVASHAGTIAFVHCGVLSVGVRKMLGIPSPFDMRFSNPIDLQSVAQRYPRTTFVVPHFGAGYFREALMLCDLCPNVMLDTSSSNSWIRYEELDLRTVFRRALEVLGPNRLLFGTDSSFFPRGWNAQVFQTQCTALYEVGLKIETARLLFHDNLSLLFP